MSTPAQISQPLPEALERRVVRIAQLDDARLDDYRNVRDKELLGRRRLFIAESEVVLRVLLARGRFPVRSVLLAAPRANKLVDLLEAVDPALPIYLAEHEILNKIIGFPIHRGVLAAGERVPAPSPEALLAALPPGPRRVVVLEGLTNHDNVGGVFRNAAAFAADAVLLDRRTCHPLYRKAIRVSVGASLFVPFAWGEDSAALLKALRDAGFTTLALSPRQDAVTIDGLRARGLPERLAILLGSEGPGLRAETLGAADIVARIAIAPDFDSLNVATTSGIALHTLRPG